MGCLRLKALFQCFLLLSSLFTVSLLAPPVVAREDACCEKTLSGESCIYTAKRDCDLNYNTAYTSCDQTTYCKPVCCVDVQTGVCYKQVPASTCSQRGGGVMSDPLCPAQQCKQGCCQIGNQCSLQTERSCQLMTNRYPNLQGQDTFDETITSEIACINQCRSGEEGCCVAQNGCEYVTRGQCTGDFSSGRYCSDSSLSCGTKAKDRKGCVEGSDDVYWFDNEGNKEGIAEDCDYTKGTLCQVVGGVAACRNVDCGKTVAIPNNPHDPKLAVGGPRKNGESWCSYDSGVGDFLDRPGSRHYQHECINGKEFIAECRDFRDQICVQSTTPDGLSVGNCINNEIYDSKVTVNVSTVPRGQKFWEDDTKNKETCSAGTTKCTVVWVKKNSLSSWECKQNCQCEEQAYLDQMAKYCKSKGDCGADVNIFDKRTTDGLRVTWSGTGRGGRPTSVSEEFWTNISVYGIYGGMLGLQQLFEDILAQAPNVPGFLDRDVVLGGTITATVLTATLVVLQLAGVTLPWFFTGTGLLQVLGISITPAGIVLVAVVLLLAVVFGGGKTAEKTVTINCEPWVAPSGGDDCKKCNDDPRYQSKNYEYSVSCSAYRCKSLGSACELINEGTDDPQCVDQHPNDATYPTITPWPEILPEGFTFSRTPDGYYIQPVVPPYTPITFGIKTDEPGQCKLDTKHTSKFSEMTSSFGSSLYSTNHNITLLVPGGKDYTYYVRCRDVKGNENTKEYFIQFATAKEPDITPPVIESTSVANGAFVSTGTRETDLTLYLNEPSSCQWSRQDQPLQEMPAENIFVCADEPVQDPVFYNTYPCRGSLNGIEDNKINDFFIRCKDMVGNEQQQSYEFSLQGTTALQITSALPQGEILTASPILQVITAGGAEQGKASCTYQEEQLQAIPFFTTGGTSHTQQLTHLTLGDYTYKIHCSDVAGNTAEQDITFSVTVDTKAPQITQIYSDGQTLYVVTNEPSTCAYSTTSSTFSREQGILMIGDVTQEHTLSLGALRYYILCWDTEQNIVGPITVIA